MSYEQKSDFTRGRFFHCDCGWAAHALHVVELFDGSPAIVEVTVVNAPSDRAFRRRLADAWRVLRGNQHALSEIVIAREEWPAFVEHVVAIDRRVKEGPLL